MTRRLKAFLFVFFALLAAASADTRYVTDELIISIRAGKGGEFAAVKTLRSGDPVTVLEEDGQFMKVRTPEGAEGWVNKQYISAGPPKARAFEELTEKYNALVEQSKGSAEAGRECERLKEENAKLKASGEQLRLENEGLKKRQSLKWFLAGAGVLFFGWIIGRISRRKRRY